MQIDKTHANTRKHTQTHVQHLENILQSEITQPNTEMLQVGRMKTGPGDIKKWRTQQGHACCWLVIRLYLVLENELKCVPAVCIALNKN